MSEFFKDSRPYDTMLSPQDEHEADRQAEQKASEADKWEHFAQPGLEQDARDMDSAARTTRDLREGLITPEQHEAQMALVAPQEDGPEA